jgi:HD-GYP domain-containing protein (c-di-GMP phosphodiesterase class II)
MYGKGISLARAVGYPVAASDPREAKQRRPGSGYPKQLRTSQILTGAKIIAVAEVFDALSADRPYRRGINPRLAARHIANHAGSLFDPDCAAALSRLVAREIDDDIEDVLSRR